MGLWRWQGRRTAIWLALEASLVVIGVVVLLSAMHNPSLDREWDEDVRVLAGVALTADGSVTLTGVRDWKYGVDTILAREYFDATFDPADIVDAWMYEQILDDGRGAIAHTFIVFEFDSTYGRARYLGLSVETRREKGEQYSLLAGMLGRFEITHTWATEQDLVARRVLYLDYSLTRYRLQLSPEQRARASAHFRPRGRRSAPAPTRSARSTARSGISHTG